MAKIQTRRTISISRAKFDVAKAAAERIGTTLARLTEDALDAYLAGDPRATTRPIDAVKEQNAQHGRTRPPRIKPAPTEPTATRPYTPRPIIDTARLVKPEPVDPDAPIPMIAVTSTIPRPTCAVCTNPCAGDHYYRLPLGKDGARVVTCITCNDEHPRSGRYSFDGGARSAISPSDSKRVVRQGGS